MHLLTLETRAHTAKPLRPKSTPQRQASKDLSAGAAKQGSNAIEQEKLGDGARDRARSSTRDLYLDREPAISASPAPAISYALTASKVVGGVG